MSSLFNTFLYQPLFNGLIALYNLAFSDLGLAIILLTFVVRLILYPLFYKSFKTQTLMQKIQPEVQRIQHDHKHDKEKQAQALMELYKTHKVNPFSGFILIFIQLPILIALYRVFLNGFSPEALNSVYSFITAPTEINHFFLGLIDLKNPSILMVGLSAIAQYFQGRLALPKNQSKTDQNPAVRISRQMVFLGPALTVLVLYSLPSAVGLYWLATSVFSIGQQLIINKKIYGDSSANNSTTS